MDVKIWFSWIFWQGRFEVIAIAVFDVYATYTPVIEYKVCLFFQAYRIHKVKYLNIKYIVFFSILTQIYGVMGENPCTVKIIGCFSLLSQVLQREFFSTPLTWVFQIVTFFLIIELDSQWIHRTVTSDEQCPIKSIYAWGKTFLYTALIRNLSFVLFGAQIAKYGRFWNWHEL